MRLSRGSADSNGDEAPEGTSRSRGDSESAAAVEMVVNTVVDSYRPALESCFEVLQSKVEGMPLVSIEDNTFSLTVREATGRT